jgi:hypothetical protein
VAFFKVLKSGLVAFIPVAAALAVWIFLRSDNLAKLSEGMEPGFLVPETPGDALRIGLTIWLPTSLILSLVSSLFYYFSVSKWRWRPWQYAAVPVGLAVLISIAAFAAGMPFAVEATGETMIIALGYGILIPWLSRK